MTLHDMTLPYFTSLLMAAARMGRGRGHRRKTKQSCAHSCCQRSLTPIQAHSLPSACFKVTNYGSNLGVQAAKIVKLITGHAGLCKEMGNRIIKTAEKINKDAEIKPTKVMLQTKTGIPSLNQWEFQDPKMEVR